MPADSIASVARDLASLAASDRRAILAALAREDRDRLRAAMRGEAAPVAQNTGAAKHSPWFAALVVAARDPQAEGAPSAAARAALLDAVGAEAAVVPHAPGRSLLQAAGGLLAGARAR
ncbi:hypothetical protein [Sphingomonas sp.]|jgi:hypothetical protein|uniref:hypothetical protein n=1 Tax=Sphingomonas sp. TaxID=28214 RepID=UPI002E33A597|nr:hypothetical protein [Sphingomonas sp.]HEX4695798.1 hypothetical protein [Sphingomonas sp.]